MHAGNMELTRDTLAAPVHPGPLDLGVLELAMYTFGDLDTAEAWMRDPHEHLGGTPERVCRRSVEGMQSVVRLLHAIASGTEP